MAASVWFRDKEAVTNIFLKYEEKKNETKLQKKKKKK